MLRAYCLLGSDDPHILPLVPDYWANQRQHPFSFFSKFLPKFLRGIPYPLSSTVRIHKGYYSDLFGRLENDVYPDFHGRNAPQGGLVRIHMYCSLLTV